MNYKGNVRGKRWAGVLVATAALFWSAAALAGTYFVSPVGSAAWPACANINTPCSADTAMENVAAGDVVYFRGGDYYPPAVADPSFPTWYPHASGTASQPIVLMAYPGETPIIHQPAQTGNSQWGAAGIGVGQHDWIIWDGFRLIKTSQIEASSLYQCYMGNNNTIRNSEFIGRPALDSTNQVGIIISNCKETYIYNNVFRDFNGGSIEPNGTNENTGGMWLFSDDHAYVYNNNFYNSGNGIQTKDRFSYIYAHANFFINVIRPFHWQQQWTPNTEHPDYVRGFYIYNNIAVLPSGGTFLYAFGPYAKFYDNAVYNNTVYCQSSCKGLFQSNDNMLNFNVWNNIIYGAAGTTTFAHIQSGLGVPEYLNNNNYYTAGTADWRWGFLDVTNNIFSYTAYSTIEAWRSAWISTGFDADSLIDDPQFVNRGGTHAADYKRLSYPENGRGGTSYSPVMGAYRTGNERIGYLPLPKNLR
jgi:hypothetical protein